MTGILFDRGRPRDLLSALWVAVALFCSGASALVNEVVWQRSLTRFLGGSETTSSMLVVLVFMFGLGAGSIVTARRAKRLVNPLRAFAVVEGVLAVLNTGVCLLLRSDLTDAIYRFQVVAAASGIPISLLFALSTGVILLAPCVVMGATMPLASEICQRSLRLQNPRVLGLVFFCNTFGSVAGAVAASFYMIPRFGYTASIAPAIAMNLVAALALLALDCNSHARRGGRRWKRPASFCRPPALRLSSIGLTAAN